MAVSLLDVRVTIRIDEHKRIFPFFSPYKSPLTLYMQTSNAYSIVNISPRLISDMLKWSMTQLQSKYAVLFHSYNVSLKVMVRMSLCVIELRLT